MSDLVDTFLAITGSDDQTTAQHFLEMSNNDLDTAISLFFEHGGSNNPSVATNTSFSDSIGTRNMPAAGSTDGMTGHTDGKLETDEQMAERLQNEAYRGQGHADEPRAPMEARHERLVGDDVPFFGGGVSGFGGMFNRPSSVADELFGSARRGIFNQVDLDDEGRFQVLDDEDEDDVDEEGGVSVEKRLAKIFRPPFDLIEKSDLNTARAKAKRETKWILINIQDTSDFQCQILNRDFWSNISVKEVVKEHFIFLQYHKDSRGGEQYVQFYPFDKYPHIAILDPITGERLKFWSKVPNVSGWVSEVYDFLNDYSLDPSTINPNKSNANAVEDLDLLDSSDEDDEMDYSDADDSLEILQAGDSKDPIELDSDEEVEKKELTETEKVKQIKPLTTAEPTVVNLTRIQIRTGDGKRVIRKFETDQMVRDLYGFVKGYLIDQGNTTEENKLFFTLTSQRENLINKLDDTIEDAGLKNASVLVEVLDDED